MRDSCVVTLWGLRNHAFFFSANFTESAPPAPRDPPPSFRAPVRARRWRERPPKCPTWRPSTGDFQPEKKKKRNSNAGLPATFQRGKRVFAAHARVSTALRIFALGPSRWVLGEFWASTLTPPSPIQLVQPTTPLNARERAATAGFAGAWVHGTLMGQRMRRRCRSCGCRHIG